MNEFITRYQDEVSGFLTGFDRLVFRGSLRSIVYAQGMDKCRTLNGVLLKDFGRYAEKASARLEEASLAEAKRVQRPIEYLRSSKIDKEKFARTIAERDRVRDGLVCVLRCIEPCSSFEVYRNREEKRLQLKRRPRKCMHLYHYQFHPVLGWMNARIQTWFPFSIQICLNGREWLARQLDHAGSLYLKHDNCMAWVQDWQQAQRLMEQQLTVNWPRLLDGIAAQINPALEEILGKWEASYYWSTYQCEWATDVVFRDGGRLRKLFERMVRHSMTALSCTDVMRYLGRRVRLDGSVPQNCNAEVVMDMKKREEGVRIKHRINDNSLKAYDKAFTTHGNVLRFEATTLDVSDLKAYRPTEGDPDGKLAWRPMRRGIADLHRLAQVSDRATERYMNALAQVDESSTVQDLVERLSQPKQWKGQRVRGLQPFGKDHSLLLAVNRGEFLLQGVRNRDLQKLLFAPTTVSEQERRRRGAWVSRQLRLLRAHSLIEKVPRTHRYQVTETGRKVMAALFAAWNAKVSQLTALAA
jgi:hypothetical protein